MSAYSPFSNPANVIDSEHHSHRMPDTRSIDDVEPKNSIVSCPSPCNIYATANYGIYFWTGAANILTRNYKKWSVYISSKISLPVFLISDSFSMLRTPSA